MGSMTFLMCVSSLWWSPCEFLALGLKKAAWARLPTYVLLIPSYVVAKNLERVPVPEHSVDVLVVSPLDHSDSDTEQRHAIALLQGSLAPASVVILLALFDQVLQSCGIVS